MYRPVHGGKYAAAFGSYGWSGEAVPHLTERLKQLGMKVMKGLRVRLKPNEKELMDAYDFGYAFGCFMQRKEPLKPVAGTGLVKCMSLRRDIRRIHYHLPDLRCRCGKLRSG